MGRMFVIAAFVSALAVPTQAQFVTQEKVPPTSGCYRLSTYDQGLNIYITVSTTQKIEDSDLSQNIARDLSRFKDTGEVHSSSEAPPAIDKRPVGFDVHVTVAAVKTDSGTVGYVVSFYSMEMCSVFDGRRGFSVQGIWTAPPVVRETREQALDFIEKQIYDSLMATAKARRQATFR